MVAPPTDRRADHCQAIQMAAAPGDAAIIAGVMLGAHRVHELSGSIPVCIAVIQIENAGEKRTEIWGFLASFPGKEDR